MTAIIIKAILIIIAAICKAAANTIAHHPHTSRLTGKFWDMRLQGKLLPLTKYPLDGWHVSNSIMILSFIVYGALSGYSWYVDIPASGVLFTITFNLFYNQILQKK